MSTLRKQDSKFAKDLSRHLRKRILERRGLNSRLCRFVQDRTASSQLDVLLEEEMNQEGASSTTEDIVGEIAKFQQAEGVVFGAQDELQEEENEPQSAMQPDELDEDEYDQYIRKNRTLAATSEKPTAEKLLKLHKKGYEVLPRGMVETANILQPTSIPAERAFSKARSARRYNQECMSDNRFCDYRLLADCFSSSKPWVNTKSP